ncbi:MAG: class I SAM-dependent methyltransferase [Desulfocapsa sp.]|nr:class I SAM-dependent methyltransferase [Desulfocapsa sp.]
MQKVHCNLCGADNTNLLFVGHDRLHKLPGEFRMVKCRECGLIYQNPQLDPREILTFYPEDYHSYYTPIDQETSWFSRLDRQRGVQRRCQVVQKRVGKPGRLLDVGCGTGVFINGMHQNGWQVFGSDLNRKAVELARAHLDFDIRVGELAEIHYPDNFFDVLTMWDVLEHVHDPRGTLVEVARILKPGGWAIINIPNPIGLDARIFGETWIGWDVPRHLHIMSPALMNRYLEESGFSPAEFLSFTGRHGAMILNLQFLLDERVRNRRLRQTLMSIAGSLPARLITWPFHWVSEKFFQSTTFTVITQTRHKEANTTANAR